MQKLERLDKIVSNMGYGSRKDIKKLAKDGLIEVNGKVAKKTSLKVDPYKDEILVNGHRVEYKEHIYIMMNKPQGYISATEDNLSYTVLELLEYQHQIFEPFPAGRLDKDTEGLLILTNDGKFSHNITSPKKKVEKVYYAEVDGEVLDKHIDEFKKGLVLDDGYETKEANLKILDSSEEASEILLTITEGKFHQVKRMFNAIGMEVTYLKRVSIGTLDLDDDLELGEYRELTEEELEDLNSL